MDVRRVLEFVVQSDDVFERLGLLGIIIERNTLPELLRAGLGGHHFLWTAGYVHTSALTHSFTCAYSPPQSLVLAQLVLVTLARTHVVALTLQCAPRSSTAIFRFGCNATSV